MLAIATVARIFVPGDDANFGEYLARGRGGPYGTLRGAGETENTRGTAISPEGRVVYKQMGLPFPNGPTILLPIF